MSLETQRKKDKEFADWAYKNQPPGWVRNLFLLYFAVCGILPFTAGSSALLAEVGFSPTQYIVSIALAFGQPYIESHWR